MLSEEEFLTVIGIIGDKQEEKGTLERKPLFASINRLTILVSMKASLVTRGRSQKKLST